MYHRFLKMTAVLIAIIFISSVIPAAGQSGYPSRFDLRDLNLVSSVKDQSPWGSCWAYGTTAAAEISILAQLRELGPDYAEYYADPDNLDLSELQLAWFSYTKLPEYSPDDPHSQAGEGSEVINTNRLNRGGYSFMSSNSYADGIGPIPEALAPYRAWEGDADEYISSGLNEEELYDEEGIWYVPEEMRFTSAFELYESRDLPEFWTGDEDQGYVFHEEAIDAIKDELLAQRGVAVSYCADTTRGDDWAAGYDYLNPETYAHYIPEYMNSNHVVCIVGWDDNYSRSNFVEGNQPPADGAWIAKNSWGAVDPDDEFYDEGDGWGVDGSGYFYLSYYDHSARRPRSFVFDLLSEDSYTDSVFRVIDQYDLFNSMSYSHDASDFDTDEIGAANVFMAYYDQFLRAVSLNTAENLQTVNLLVYRLDPDWETPQDGDLLYADEVTFEYAGWHKIDFDEIIELYAGDEFSLVMFTDSIQIEETTIDLAEELDPEKAQEVREDNTIIVNPGDSFFMFNDAGIWYDWTDLADYLDENSEFPTYISWYDNPGLKAYSEPMQNMTAFLEVYISDQGWVEGSEMYFRVVIGNPYGAYTGPVLVKSALSGLADSYYIEDVPDEGTAEVNYIYNLTAEDVEDGTVTEFVTVYPLDAPHFVGQTLRLSVFD